MIRNSLDIKQTGFNQYEITSKRSGKIITPFPSTKVHKYGKPVTYIMFTYYDVDKKKNVATTLSRAVWMYFNEDLPSNIDVDHIDGNTLNNDLSNLQALTRRENLIKKQRQSNQHSEIAELTEQDIYYIKDNFRRRFRKEAYQAYVKENEMLYQSRKATGKWQSRNLMQKKDYLDNDVIRAYEEKYVEEAFSKFMEERGNK